LTADSARNGLVFLVDDDPHLSVLVAELLRHQGYAVSAFSSGEACLQALTEATPSVVLLDLHMPGMGGEATLDRIVAHYRHLPVIVFTGDTEVTRVVDTIKRGAYDFIPKPVDPAKLLTVVGHAVERHRMALKIAELERQHEARGFPGIVGQSSVMLELARQIERVAATDVTVAIHGESGTGKELVARAIHEFSGRAKAPFVALNCAALPESLQESELFGHEKGSFTGATARRAGRFEQGNGGTVFLDEVAELSPGAQAKLLRVLQERLVQRVGGSEDVPVDFRLVAATHRDLSEAVRLGRFREDLYFRIVVYELEVPPLRARQGDVPLLADHFIERHGERLVKSRPHLHPEALSALERYPWPGNVRELENTLQRAIVSCSGNEIRLLDLPQRLREPGAASAAVAPVPTPSAPSAPAPTTDTSAPSTTPATAPMTLEEAERQMIVRALERCNGNRSLVAQQLGIGRTTLYRKLKEYGLE
jgi:DNA-binding NtrC family response regulator